MARGLLVLAPLVLAAAASAEDAAAPKVVHLKTKDGLSLEADWYPGGEGMPGIVGLHMYPADRTSWKPLAEARPKGFHFLAIDLRGYGGSRMQDGKDLSERVKSRDPILFNAMWQDALAGVEFLRGEAKCDPKRIGLVGASVGCSIAIDTAVRDGKIAGVAVLTPGKNYLGVPTMDHVKSWGETPLLILSSEEEADGGARPIAEALKGKPAVELRIVPGERIHGTQMFGKVPGVERGLGRWFAASLARQILDGKVDATEWENGENGTRIESVDGSSNVRIDLLGLSFACRRPEASPPPPEIRILAASSDPSDPESGLPEGTRRLRGVAAGEGALLSSWTDTFTGGKWKEEPRGQLEGAAMVRGGVLEGRIPWSLVAPSGAREVFLRVRLGGTDREAQDLGGSTWLRFEIPRWE